MKTIKQLKLATFLLTFILLATYSCKSDDDSGSNLENTEENRQNLIGTWRLTGETYNGEVVELYICELLSTNTFTNTTVNTKSYYDPSNSNGSNCILDTDFTQDYTINGAIITITVDDFTFSGEILELTATTLKIKFEFEEDGDVDTEITTYLKQ